MPTSALEPSKKMLTPSSISGDNGSGDASCDCACGCELPLIQLSRTGGTQEHTGDTEREPLGSEG